MVVRKKRCLKKGKEKLGIQEFGKKGNLDTAAEENFSENRDVQRKNFGTSDQAKPTHFSNAPTFCIVKNVIEKEVGVKERRLKI